MSKAAELAALIGSQTSLSNRNLIINGEFQCWQRGVSVGDGSTVLNDEFLADRWRCDDGVGGNMIISQQSFTTGQTDVPNNPKFYHRLDFPTTAPSDNGTVEQRIEGVSTAAGETTTLSFWAKGTMSSSISINVVQYFGTGGSPSTTVDTSVTTFSLTSSWVKHTVNINVASISGKTIGSDGNDYLSVKFLTGTNTGQFDLAQVQLELGEQATPFEHRSYGDELLRCQRYFEGGTRANASHTGNAGLIWTQKNNSSSRSFPQMNAEYKVFKRATPTVTIESGQDGTANRISGYSSGTNYTVTSIEGPSPSYVCSYFQTTGGLPDQITAGYYTADAEL